MERYNTLLAELPSSVETELRENYQAQLQTLEQQGMAPDVAAPLAMLSVVEAELAYCNNQWHVALKRYDEVGVAKECRMHEERTQLLEMKDILTQDALQNGATLKQVAEATKTFMTESLNANDLTPEAYIDSLAASFRNLLAEQNPMVPASSPVFDQCAYLVASEAKKVEGVTPNEAFETGMMRMANRVMWEMHDHAILFPVIPEMYEIKTELHGQWQDNWAQHINQFIGDLSPAARDMLLQQYQQNLAELNITHSAAELNVITLATCTTINNMLNNEELSDADRESLSECLSTAKTQAFYAGAHELDEFDSLDEIGD